MFLFVAKVSEEERARATAAAFAKAERNADRLARAAGVELGGLHRLTDRSEPGFDPDGAFGGMHRRDYPYSTGTPLFRSVDGPADDTELSGWRPVR